MKLATELQQSGAGEELLRSLSDAAVQGTYLTVAVIPALLMAVSLVAIWMYRLDEKSLAANSQ